MLQPLPIDDFIPQILALLKEQGNLVVAAEPGAGKTTRLPPALISQISGQIFVLEPRRMAAIAASQRIAEELGVPLGSTVGYQVRFDNRTSAQTKITFMTEALLTRRLLSDPELKGVGAIILDEFHERSLNVDLALGMAKELQQLGHPLKIIVMSATLDTEKVSAYLDNCAVVKVPGKTFPLKIHQGQQSIRTRTDPDFFKNFAALIKIAFSENQGDLLAFLPGTSEIERTRKALQDWAQQNQIETFMLHGSIPLDQQRQILAPAKNRRLILSTNVAESSVTVNGVTTVVDSGLVKVLRQDPRTGFSRLDLSKISQASSVQRAGRAARQAPGQCYRPWSVTEQQNLAAFELPEVLRVDIAECLLFLSAQGIQDYARFSWFEAPSAAQLKRATRDLQDLGAIDKTCAITNLGKKMLAWPLPPRLAKLMVMGQQSQLSSLAADLCALMLERDILQRDAFEKYLGDAWECDLSLRWSLLNNWRNRQADQDVIFSAVKMVDLASKQLQREKKTTAQIDDVAKLLLQAFPDRLCRRRGSTEKAMMSGGRGVKLSPQSVVKTSAFFIALDGVDLEGSADTLVSLACGVDLTLLQKTFSQDITTRERTYFDDDKQRFLTVKETVWKDFVLEVSQPRAALPESIQEGLVDALFERLDWLKTENEALRIWFDRWNFLAQHNSKVETLSEEKIKSALASAAFGESTFQSVAAKDLIYHFESQLAPEDLQSLQKNVPAKISVPSGSLIDIHYPAEQAPFMQLRLQELFGWTQTPKVMNDQVALVIHLLAPNFRPVQTTADLSSFWRSGYFEVRKELKIRYPKHSWPEDPLTAKPEAKGRRRT